MKQIVKFLNVTILKPVFYAVLIFISGGMAPANAVFDPVNDDTDIFLANPNIPSQRPNVLIVLDNTANWSRNVEGQAININELKALKTVVQNLSDQFNVGLMMFPETGNPNDNIKGGVVRYHIRQMTTANKAVLAALVDPDSIPPGMDGNDDKSNNNVISLVMSEAYFYFAGKTNISTFGKEKGDWAGNGSHETSGLPGEHALDSATSTAVYNSPINADNLCADNFIIFISNGDAAQNSSTNTQSEGFLATVCPACDSVIQLDPTANNRQVNWTDEWAGFMANTDMNGAADGEPHVYTYVVEVDPQTGGNDDDHTALMKSTATQGKGKYFAVTSGNGGQAIVNALNQIFSEIQAVNSVFASTTLPVSVNVRGTNLNQVYIGVFRPDEAKAPRWFGNLKAYQLGFDTTTSTLFLADKNGVAAENTTTGFINPNVTSFWSAASTFWDYRDADRNGVGGSSDAPDGDLVEKGGAAQQLRIDFATDQGPRNLYTCTPAGVFSPACETGDSLSATPFATSNDAITGGALGLSSKDISALTALDTKTLSDLTDTRPVTALTTTGGGEVTLTNTNLQVLSGPQSVTSLRTGSVVSISSMSNGPVFKTISDARRDNPKTQATITVSNHGYSNGQIVHITGVGASDFNNTFTISQVTTNDFVITKGTDFSSANPSVIGAQVATTSTSVTMDTATPHGLTGSPTVTIAGVTPTTFNSASKVVNVIDADTLSFTTSTALAPVTSVAGATITTTTTTATATVPSHGYADNSFVSISGASPAAYNKTNVQITKIDDDTFTYDVGASLAAASGTIFVNQGPVTVTATTSENLITDLGLVIAGNPYLDYTITGALPSGFNGTYDITIVDDNHYTYTVAAGLQPAATTFGTATGGGAATTNAVAVIPDHGFGVNGDPAFDIVIDGATDGAYNGTFSDATVIDKDTISFTLIAAPASTPASGTITAWLGTDTSNTDTAIATVDTSRSATYDQTSIPDEITVTYANHGFSVGSVVYLDFTSGGAPSDTYTVATVPDASTFTVTPGGGTDTSGNVNIEGHGYVDGQDVSILDADQSDFNVTDATIDVIDGYTFHYPITSASPRGPATTIGNIIATAKTKIAHATVPDHNFNNGDTITISGATPGAFNGPFVIAVVDADHFNYTLATAQGVADASLASASGASIASTEIINLINWVRGQDNYEDENINASNTDVRASVHGDVLHSRPAVVNYNRHGNDDDVYIFYGSNDGVFRAVKGGFAQSDANEPEPGEEAWGFIPEEFLSSLSRLRLNTPIISSADKKPYFADGSIGVYVDDSNNDGSLVAGDGDKVYLFISMHRGGRLIYALDVSDPSDPKFLWKKSNIDWPELGQTWSVPFVTTINAQSDPVLIFGGGYDPLVEDIDPDTISSFNVDVDNNDDLEVEVNGGAASYERSMGRSIFVVDAFTGDLIFQAGGDGVTDNNAADDYLLVSGMDCAIPNDAAVLTDRAGSVDNRAYFADTCANIWRLDMEDADPGNWIVTKLADLNDESDIPGGLRKFLFPPDVVYGDNFDAVLIGSGDREHPFNDTVTDRFYMVRDLGTSTSPGTSNVTEADLFDATSNCLQSSSSCSGSGDEIDQITAAAALDSGLGWYITLGTGEKVVGNSVTLNNVTFFNTNQPSSGADFGSCASDLGVARQYQVNYDDATAYKDKNLDGNVDAADRSIVHPGGGYLPSPVPVVVQIDGVVHEGVISGVKVEQPPGSLLGARLRKFWFKEFE